MRFKDINMSRISIIIVTLVCLAVTVLIGRYVMTVEKEILEVTCVKLKSLGVQVATEIERSIEESEDDLSLLAQYVGKADINLENAVDILQKQSQVEEFSCIYYVDLKGNGISTDGSKSNFAQNTTFLHSLDRDFVISMPHLSTKTDELIFDVAVPVLKNDVMTGVLLSEVPISDLHEIMDIKAKDGLIFIMDRKLNILFTLALGEHKANPIFADNVNTLLGKEDMHLMLQDALDGKRGVITYRANYDSKEVEKILTYEPMEGTDWVLVIAIEESSINIDLKSAMKQITNVSIVIFFIMIFFIVYIWIYRICSLRSLEKTAYYDPLTNLPNMTKLKKSMSEILKANKETKYTVIKIDVENFKAINEMFGFEVGNKVLKLFKTIRDSVDEPTLSIYRTGIDEFMLFSSNGFLDDMEERTGHYESFYKKYIPELGSYIISFKYGRYHIPLGDTNVDEIINKVNLAHRIAKEHKEIIIYDYNESYTKKILEEATLTSKMTNALHNQEFKVYFQPKFSLKNDSLVGVEALVRWQEADGTMIYPNAFIPLFEKNGFIVELDKYVLEQVCLTLRKWIDKKIRPIPVSVNCSRNDLRHTDIVETITRIVDKHNIPHEYIEIELTETATIENEEIIEKLFEDLRNHKFKISIDDFGAGYSSLGLLKNLKVDTLKMDRSFFTGESDSQRSEYVVDGFIKLAHNLGMYVVAEGIETESQLNTLKGINCDAVQGYVYAKPMPISEFEEKYKYQMQ